VSGKQDRDAPLTDLAHEVEHLPASNREEVAGVFNESDAQFRMSTLDQKFLCSLKIAVDEEK